MLKGYSRQIQMGLNVKYRIGQFLKKLLYCIIAIFEREKIIFALLNYLFMQSAIVKQCKGVREQTS